MRIRFERTVCNTFNEKLFVSVEKELRPGTNSRGFVFCHVGVLCCHFERSHESPIIFHTQPTKQRPEIFRLPEHEKNDRAGKRRTPTALSTLHVQHRRCARYLLTCGPLK